MRRALFLALILVMAASAAFAASNRSIVAVYAPNYDTYQFLRTFPVSFEESGRAGWAQVICRPETVAELRAAGFEVEVLVDDFNAYIKERAAVSAAKLGEPTPKDVVLDHYLTWAEVKTFLQQLAAAYPELMTLTTIGESVQGRDLFLVQLTGTGAPPAIGKPAIYLEGTIHGDEIVPYIWMLSAIQWLLDGYGNDATVTQLMDTHEFYVNPLVNPDGNAAMQRFNADGIDCNRNFGYMWNPNNIAPEDPSVAGPYPHSEPEVIAVAKVWQGARPFELAIDGHNGDALFLWPWGYKTGGSSDDPEYSYLGGQYIYPGLCQDPDFNADGNTYDVLYSAAGVNPDELRGGYGTLGLTFEMSNNKQPAFSQSLQIWEWHKPAFTWLLQELNNGLHGTVTDAQTGDPVAATIVIANKWHFYTDPDIGDFHRYLRAGNYSLRVFANGYNDYTGQVTIVDGTPTIRNVQMTPAAGAGTYAWRWMYDTMPNIDQVSTYPASNVLGPPDGDYFGLGAGGWVVLDLGPTGIVSTGGLDIAVFQGGAYTDKPYALYGSTGDAQGPWTLIGDGSGTSAFGLGSLTSVRFVKVVDTSSTRGEDDGFDLDAVGTPGSFVAFYGAPTTGDKPLPVQFTDHSTGSPSAWLWDFGDQTTSTEQNPQHTYQDYGTYDVTLTVDGTRSLTKPGYITVVAAQPTADFSGTPTTGPAPLQVSFTAETTGYIDTYAWQFGDNGTSSDQNPVHTYENSGWYSVTLTVTGPGGSNNKYKWRYIDATAPAADDDDDNDDDNDDNDNDDDDTSDDDNDASPADDDDDATPADDDDDASPSPQGSSSSGGGCGC
jgi:PKD repeat protein